ncbi:hypothetical protein ASZ90_000532 [hydrocarbon metagenome]|uniref:Uncharacterized protein n=1 Tax=hydrocarbon metagenome TaxID=938273 RepID=A0A0W8G8U4_9ZZZZ
MPPNAGRTPDERHRGITAAHVWARPGPGQGREDRVRQAAQAPKKGQAAPGPSRSSLPYEEGCGLPC